MNDSSRPLAPQGPGGYFGPRPPVKAPRKWLPWALGGCGCLLIAAIAVIGIVAAIILLGGRSPEQTVRDYNQAWDTADCDLFFETTTESFRNDATCEDFVTAVEQGGEGTMEIISSQIDGDRAVVHTREVATLDGSTYSGKVEYRLVKDDGTWLIDANIHY